MTVELPTFSSSLGYTTTSTITGDDWVRTYDNTGTTAFPTSNPVWVHLKHHHNQIDITPCEEDREMSDDVRRIVRVFIVDTDENVPLDKCVLYNGDEQVTDLTDEELFFELSVKEMLDKHNAFRVNHEYEEKGKTKKLDKIRIKDLHMTVVTIARLG